MNWNRKLEKKFLVFYILKSFFFTKSSLKAYWLKLLLIYSIDLNVMFIAQNKFLWRFAKTID